MSRNGHILEERRIRLNWRPRFGPDNGDVAALETELDAAMVRVQGHAVPEDAGPYVPQACEISASGPEIHAVFHYLVEEFKQATAALGITIEQSIAFLGLPAGTGPDGLYPFAITPKRDSRMRRVTALASLVARQPTVGARLRDMVEAVLREDVPTILGIFKDTGIEPNGDLDD